MLSNETIMVETLDYMNLMDDFAENGINYISTLRILNN